MEKRSHPKLQIRKNPPVKYLLDKVISKYNKCSTEIKSIHYAAKWFLYCLTRDLVNRIWSIQDKLKNLEFVLRYHI